MDSVVQWYKSEVYFWRSAGSLFWGIILLIFPLAELFVIFSRLSLFKPWFGLADGLCDIVSVSFCFNLTVLIIILLAIVYTSQFSVIPKEPCTRLERFLGLLRWSRLPHLLSSCVGGALVAWSCSHFMEERYSSLTSRIITANGEIVVLNECCIFVILSGLVAGWVYYCNFYLSALNYLAFPILQRNKLFRVRTGMVQMMERCIYLTWCHVRILYLGYWISGAMLRNWVMRTIGLYTLSEHQPLDSMLGLMDVGLVWRSASVAFFIFISWNLAAVLYSIYHTQHLEIHLSATGIYPENKHSLTEALTAESVPLLQHLAFLDLAQLSAQSPERRQQVFSLSQPGGHPHIWRAICSTCLLQVESLAARVHTVYLEALAALPIQNAPADKIFQTGDTSQLLKSSSYVVHSPTGVLKVSMSPSPSPLAFSFFTKPIVCVAMDTLCDATELCKRVAQWIPGFTKEGKPRVYSGVKNKPLLSYFLMDLPDSKSSQLFVDCLTRIWAVEALSMLAAASYQEDKYGVVQQSLPAIFSSLVTLQDNIEKYFKLHPLASRRMSKDCSSVPHVALCHQLRMALKTALYRITNKFGKHMDDLHLSSDCLKRMRPYLDYKE